MQTLIDTQTAVDLLVAELQEHTLCVDLEFASARHYVPRLCVLQVAWRTKGATHVRLIDAQAVDVSALVALLGDGREVVMHAAKQDLGILRDHFGLAACSLFDTQIAASLLTSAEQLSYAKLAEEVVRVTVDKSQQWTDWEKRPLRNDQLEYAATDVAHLPAIAEAMKARLDKRARRTWCREECDALVRDVLTNARPKPQDAWKDVPHPPLTPQVIGALQALAAWRLETAIHRDLPLGHVMKNEVLIDLAKARPSSLAALERITRGLDMERYGAAILAAIAAASPIHDTSRGGAPPTPRAQAWTDVMFAYATHVATRENIAPRVLATRADIEAVAIRCDRSEATESLRVCHGWRRAVVGDAMIEFLRGERVLAVTASGLDLRN